MTPEIPVVWVRDSASREIFEIRNGNSTQRVARPLASPTRSRPQPLDIVRITPRERDHDRFILPPKPLRRLSDNAMAWRVKVREPSGSDINVGEPPKIERKGPRLSHQRRDVGVDTVNPQGARARPRPAGRIGQEYRVHTIAARRQRDVSDMARPWLRRVLALRVIAPNEIAGAIGVNAQPCLA